MMHLRMFARNPQPPPHQAPQSPSPSLPPPTTTLSIPQHHDAPDAPSVQSRVDIVEIAFAIIDEPPREARNYWQHALSLIL